MAQRIVDTTGRYNGEYTKKKIEYSRAGGTRERNILLSNGRIEQENFYHDGVPYHGISFDQNGKTTAEWGDRENGLEKWKKRRPWILSLTIIFFAIPHDGPRAQKTSRKHFMSF